MALPLRAALLLLAALALALAVSPAAGRDPGKQPRLVGGPIEADAKEEGVQRALEFAISEYNKASNDKYHSRVVEVLRTRKQIVSGVNYFIDVLIGRTTCTKSQPNLATCPFHDQGQLSKKTHCSFQVYTVPWMNITSLVKFNCREA
ncbi:cystatin-C [Dasypus novemcinctus]|uniref:cystatin-C n=1 Tax=Dasypus novemcinctus TaxID=9361 RepID=UPI0003289234|nr:cystatin-C [Dasypus novemcinctus]